MKYDVLVVIPTHNDFATLLFTIGSMRRVLKSSRISGYFMIVADKCVLPEAIKKNLAGSNDQEVIQVNYGNPGRSRNQGVFQAKNRNFCFDYICFIDADCSVAGNFAEVVSLVRSGAASFATGKIMAPIGCSVLQYVWAPNNQGATRKNTPVSKASGAFLFIKAESFDKVGGFDASLVCGEDEDFTLRLSIEVGSGVLVPNFFIYHYDYPDRLFGFFKKGYWHNDPNRIKKENFKDKTFLFFVLALFFGFLTGFLCGLAIGGVVFILMIFILSGITAFRRWKNYSDAFSCTSKYFIILILVSFCYQFGRFFRALTIMPKILTKA